MLARAARENSDAYQFMEELSQTAPAGADGVFALVSDVMNAKRWVQAPVTFLGIDITTPRHGGDAGRARLIRAVQESAAFTARAHWDLLRELSGLQSDSLTFCGGASKGKLWPQIMADVFGLPVRLPRVKETTSLGAALCALVGTGEYQTLAEGASAIAQWDRSVEPIPQHVERYEQLRRRHAALQANMMDLVNQGKLPALWSAPGIQ
jgi:autoinducer 2 (AI-2) kinase